MLLTLALVAAAGGAAELFPRRHARCPPLASHPQGSLDMQILQVLSLEFTHGYAIARRLQQFSRDAAHHQGSPYPSSCTASSRTAG